MKVLKTKLKAFNLQELLVVLVVVGILILLALPNLMPLISKAKSMEAQNQLVYLYSLEKNYFYVNSKYSLSLSEIDFIAPQTVRQGGKANYVYEVLQATNNTFRAKATAVTDFDGDGVFNVWEIDQNKDLKEIIKD